MKRRAALLSLLALGAASAPLRVAAQAQLAPRRVGILFADSRAARADLLASLEDGLRSLGYRIGADLDLDVRYANGDPRRLAELAIELARGDATVLVAAGTGPAEAVRRATVDKPILFIGVGDPVARGFVASLEHPDRNMTGSTDLQPGTHERRLALVAEVLPAARKVAMISNPSVTPREPHDKAAAALGLALRHLDLRRKEDFAQAYAALESERPDALIVAANPTTFAERMPLAAFCRERRIATLFGWREFMDAGGLMSLGANLGKLYAAAASQLDRILKGVPVSRIPVELPAFDLVVDLRTARALGISMPQSVLGRADKIID